MVGSTFTGKEVEAEFEWESPGTLCYPVHQYQVSVSSPRVEDLHRETFKVGGEGGRGRGGECVSEEATVVGGVGCAPDVVPCLVPCPMQTNATHSGQVVRYTLHISSYRADHYNLTVSGWG